MRLTREQAYQLAVKHYQTGNLQEAEQFCQLVLDVDPDHADSNNLMGVIVLEQEGKHDAAIQYIKKAIQANPAKAAYHNNLGFVLKKTGKQEEAISCYRKALTLKPENAEFHNNLGNTLQESDRLEEAIASYRKALSLKPDYAEVHNNLGAVLQMSGRLDEAVVSYRTALSIKPDYAEVYNNLGLVFKKQEKMIDAVASFVEAILLNPDYAEAHNNLSVVYRKMGKMDDAIASIRKALSLKPDYAEAYNNLGRAQQEMFMMDDAMASYRKALSLKPDFVDALNNIGLLHGELGHMDDAIAIFEESLAIDPEKVITFKNLTSLVKYKKLDDIILAMEDLYANDTLSDKDKIHLGFSLGKVFEDLNEYEKSFGFILEANRLQHEIYEYSVQDEQNKFESIKRTFTPTLFSSHFGVGSQARTPIFILGMPRSGTTLAEQILASHPQVFGAGELTILENVLYANCAGLETKSFPECISDLDINTFTKMGVDYIDRIRKLAKDTEYITDKMPHNFLYVGLIKIILPNAKIVHCMRNPMDTCLSIFKNEFRVVHGYASDMVDLGRYYNLYQDLMEHWEKVLPGFMYPLRYEEIVSDQENETRKLLEFCGLPWDEAILSFHETSRSVKTISFAQVRQPIYKDSVDRWKRYETQLEPLRKAIYEE